MKCKPDIYHRQSIRLQWYDYARAGAYFITICIQDRVCLFGDIIDGKMVLNDAGQLVIKWWKKLQDKYDAVEIDEYVVMPNHFHGIVITTNDTIVGAIPCNRPHENPMPGEPDEKPIPGENMVSPLRVLGQYISWFKRMSTNEYIRGVKQNDWPRFNGKLWQRNYWEHIIRNEHELNRIRQYIIDNPLKWETDRDYPGRNMGAVCESPE
ncbi:MAG: transposase [Nitrospirota bacterium]|nr:transposase [Nitrospirota bacterium]